MGGLFKKPKVSKPKPVVVSQTNVEDEAAKKRAAEDEESRRKRANLASNVLFTDDGTGGDTGPVIQKKKLLGE